MAPLLAPRLHLPPAEVVQAFDLLDLPDLAAHHQWLAGENPMLQQSAVRLTEVMRRAALLAPGGAAATDGALVDPRFLPLD